MTRTVGLLGWVSALWPRPTLAQARPEALQLTWQAPGDCASAAAVRQETLRLARIGPDFDGQLVAAGRIEARAGAWHLKLVTTFRGGTGERALTAGSCSTLTETAALLLALILNPQLERESPRTEVPPRAPRKVASLELRGLAGAHVGAELGVLRRPAAELGGSVGIWLRPFALRAGLGVTPTETAYVNGNAGPGGRAWSLAVAATACWEPDLGRITVGPCAGLGVNQTRGQGIGIDVPERAVSTWVSGLAGATTRLRVTQALHVRAAAFAFLPARRPSLFINEIGAVERAARVGATGMLGLELRFP